MQGIAVVAEVENFSSHPAGHLGVTLLIDGAEVARGFVDVPAGGRAKKRFLHALAGGGGGHQAEVRIDADNFALDDSRQAEIEVSRGLRILLVDGDPRTVRNEDEVFFLDAALRAGGNRFQVQTALPDELGGRSLDAYAAIFLANVAHPSPAAAKALIAYVEGGGGVFISVGDRVDSDAWNQSLRPDPAPAARPAADRGGAPRRPRGRDRRRPPRRAPGPHRSPATPAVGILRRRRRPGVGPLLPVPAARTDHRQSGAHDVVALRDRRSGADRGPGGTGPRAAVDHDRRSRLDRPADSPRLPAADSRSRAPAGGRAVVRRRDRR